jgi:hypothetical protein
VKEQFGSLGSGIIQGDNPDARPTPVAWHHGVSEFAANGRIWIAIDLALASQSTKPKHTHPVEQGGWLFSAVTRHLEKMT